MSITTKRKYTPKHPNYSIDGVTYRWCSGAKRVGVAERISDAHYTTRDNFGKGSSRSREGLHTICKDCVNAKNEDMKNRPKEDPPEFMVCNTCGETKPNSEMGNWKNSSHGKSNMCRSCKRLENTLRDFPCYFEVLGRDGNTCYMCGVETVAENRGRHIDHVIPKSKGGSGDLENLRVSCGPCNNSKRAKTYWEVVVAQHGWKNFTVNNLYLFNENAEWHYRQILKEALERGKQ